MAPMKRPAAAAAAGAAKRGRKVSAEVAQKKAVQEQCKVIAHAVLHDADASFPKEVLKMLSQNLASCLSIPKEERHPYQVSVIEMVQTVLGHTEKSIQDSLAAAEKKVSDVDAEKSSRHAAVEATATVTGSKTAETESAKAAHDQTVHDVKEAKAVFAASKADSAAEDADVTKKETQKLHLESTLASLTTATTESLQPEASSALVKTGKEISLDTTLLGSLPSAVQKVPDDRGIFDNIVIQQASQEFARHIEILAAALAAAEPSRKERAAKIDAAAAEVAAKEALEATAKETLKAAELAQKEAEDAQKAANKALKSLGPESKQAKLQLDEAQSKLKEYTEGPLAAFQHLLVLSNVPVPEPEPEAPEAPLAPEEPAVEAAES